MGSPSSEVWQRGTWGALGRDFLEIESVLPALRELLNDNDPSVRAEALVALENLAGKGAPPAELKSLAPQAGAAASSRGDPTSPSEFRSSRSGRG